MWPTRWRVVVHRGAHRPDRGGAEAIFARIRELGGDGTMTAGLLRGIEDGWFIGEIADSSFAYQVALEKGDKRW